MVFVYFQELLDTHSTVKEVKSGITATCQVTQIKKEGKSF